jgi:hypothetical protein
MAPWLRLAFGELCAGAEGLLSGSLFAGAGISHQCEEGAESIAVGGAGIELEASGKQSALICESSFLPLAFCSLSCSVSLSISLKRLSLSCILFSMETILVSIEAILLSVKSILLSVKSILLSIKASFLS